jgi:hypothetical protein
MSGWFNIDPNKLKQLATSTLINAQKQIGKKAMSALIFLIRFVFHPDKVLDIKENATVPDHQSTGTPNQIIIKYIE